MPVSKYLPEDFASLRDFASRAGVPSLADRRFVDYYYASHPSCGLYLFNNDGGQLVGTIGIEQLRFEFENKDMVIGVPSNYHALQPGVGGYLFLQWMKRGRSQGYPQAGLEVFCGYQNLCSQLRLPHLSGKQMAASAGEARTSQGAKEENRRICCKYPARRSVPNSRSRRKILQWGSASTRLVI